MPTVLAHLFWIFQLAFLIGAMPASAQESWVKLSVSTLEADLTPWARIVKDREKIKTIEEVLVASAPLRPNGEEGVVNFGFSSAAYWFVVPLSNTESQPLERLLVFEPTWLDDVRVTLIDARGGRQNMVGGDTFPFAQRAEPNRRINFNLAIQPGANTLLVRVETRDAFYVGMKLIESNRFFRDDAAQWTYFGLLYGALLSLLLFNFVLFVSTREASYLAYSAYLLCFIMSHLTYNGHSFPWLFPDSPEISNWAISIFVHLYCLSGLAFAVYFLDLKNKVPFAYRLAIGCMIALVTSFVVTGALGGYRWQVTGAIAWITVYSILALTLGIVALAKRNQAAIYYMVGSAVGLFGSTVSSLTVMSVLPYSFITFRAVDFGMLIDAIMLSLALAERISRGNRMERLRRFFSPAVANQLLSARNEDLYSPHQREIVVVFLDLRGYTNFTLTHGSEEVMRMLAEFHAVMGELIASHGATLERFSGDGMMLFFNDPVEIPDPAVKACRMTIDMQSRFENLQKVWEARSYSLSLGAGIAQGVAIIGAIGFEGRRDYAAIGNVTNLAARLCAQAQAGQTIVCSVVAKNVSQILPLQPMGALILKGYDHPVDCFEMVNPVKQ
ncbi:MAG: hypothetical protein EAZ37_11805 [Burkholderiales bacterium]|nr:MAG: hypothetical protein EAZ37_11805 [Burkholderiales bacterium]